MQDRVGLEKRRQDLAAAGTKKALRPLRSLR